MGPQGTPAALSSRTQVLVDFLSVSLPISALRAWRFWERAGAVAYSGLVTSSGAPSACAQRSQILPPVVAILMYPSEVLNTPVGMLVGWLLPACPATSFSISQRAAWKSSMN